MALLMPTVCANPLTGWMCTSAMWLLSGYNPDEFDNARMSVYMSHFPSGTSMQDVEHWAQSVRNFDGDRSDFSYYSYGADKNKEIYGSETAPIYDLRTFPAQTTELLVYSGGDDDLADHTDVERMVNDIPVRPTWNYMPPYDHLDFVWGLYANRDLYTPLIDHLDTKHKALQAQTTPDDGASISSTNIVVAAASAGSASVILIALVASSRRRRSRVARISPVTRSELTTKLRSSSQNMDSTV